jgi:hypothetical protein
MISAGTHTAGAGAATVDAPALAEGITTAESTGPAQTSPHPASGQPLPSEGRGQGEGCAPLNAEADMIRFIDAFWAHLNDMRRPAPKAEFYRLNPGTATCLMEQCRIEHARLVVLDAQRGAEWLGKSRKKVRV